MFKQRLKERSTWAGLAVLALQAGQLLFPEYAFAINVVTGIIGGSEIVRPESVAQ